MHRLSLFLIAGFLPVLVMALDCTQCGKSISGKYLRTDIGTYCSRGCLQATLPKCDVCGDTLSGRFLSADGKQFCSDACYETVLATCTLCDKPIRQGVSLGEHRYCLECAHKPRCGECQLPFTKGVKLQDDRYLCIGCRRDAILTASQAREPYERARRQLQSLTGIAIPSPPPLELVGRDVLVGKMGAAVFQADAAVVRGFYSRRENTTIYERLGREIRRETEVEEEIMMLYGQTQHNFLATAVHELTHDLIADHFSSLKQAPLWVEEGICQYLSAIYCRHMGFEEALQAIEESTNPVYGDGYRYFKQQLGDNNWAGLKHWMQTVDVSSLPASAP